MLLVLAYNLSSHMNKELTQQLNTKYPQLFSNLRWGVECGDGWFQILMALGDALTHSYSTTRGLSADGVGSAPEGVRWDSPEMENYEWKYDGIPKGIYLTQVKEKFGSLRVYHGFVDDPEFSAKAEKYPRTAELINKEQNDYISGILHMAESMSRITCEISGKPAVLHVAGGWVRTLNPDVVKETGRDYRVYSEVMAERQKAEEIAQNSSP